MGRKGRGQRGTGDARPRDRELHLPCPVHAVTRPQIRHPMLAVIFE